MKNRISSLAVASFLWVLLAWGDARADGVEYYATISMLGCDDTYCWVVLSKGITNMCMDGSAWIAWKNDTVERRSWTAQLTSAYLAGKHVDFHWTDSSCVNSHATIAYYQIR